MKNHIIGAVSLPIICRTIGSSSAEKPGKSRSAIWSIVIAIIASSFK